MDPSQRLITFARDAVNTARAETGQRERLIALSDLRTQLDEAAADLRGAVAEEIRSARAADVPWTDIADTFGVSRQRVMKMAEEGNDE